jgi:hypothetical protein
VSSVVLVSPYPKSLDAAFSSCLSALASRVPADVGCPVPLSPPTLISSLFSSAPISLTPAFLVPAPLILTSSVLYSHLPAPPILHVPTSAVRTALFYTCLILQILMVKFAEHGVTPLSMLRSAYLSENLSIQIDAQRMT